MITAWDIYWITRLDGIKECFVPLVIIGVVGTICFFIGGAVNYFSDDKPLGKKIWSFLFITIPVLLIGMASAALIPSTKTAIAIYAIPKIANNESVQQIPVNFAKLINAKLQEWMVDVDIAPKEVANGKDNRN